ncbi:hypothetical protein EVAR_31837_1 [Eumeta japonica]|uniref:Reverse transcriptase domain-containing protein n=1 Tax=Eumeta variegata TaxID=151549 RepID=A0A4C1WKV0_EUMVA|nr:hypothetical protein EVAR_31837_1 [Eumeta japonica]
MPSIGGKNCRPASPRVENSWSKPFPWVRPRYIKETITKESPNQSICSMESATSTLNEDISKIMSILQVVRSNEVADDNDNAIGAFTSYIRTVVENSSKIVPAKPDRKEPPRDVSELIRAKNAALLRANKYPTCKNRSHTHTLQPKALKMEGAVPTPALKRPNKSIAFDNRGNVECLADSIEHQCSENPSYDSEYVSKVDEKVRHRVSLQPKDDLDSITQDEVTWKEAVVIGIPKLEKPGDFRASYRPISLLRILGKLFEKTLETLLSEHLIGKDLKINNNLVLDLNILTPNKPSDY